MKAVLTLVVLLYGMLASSSALITDTTVRLYPSCGAYGYEVFRPDAAIFPALGSSFVDPVFAEILTRISNIYPTTSGSSIIYGVNGLWNANNTAYLHGAPTTVDLVNPQTGATIRSNVPYPFTTTDAVSFDPVDPDIYYYTNGTALTKYSISGNTSTTVKIFGSTLGGLGQSADWIDKTGRYFLLNLGGNLRIWDKQTDTLYTGSVPVPTGANGIPPGWAGLSPDGNYVIVSLNPEHYSYAVNHGTTTLNTTGVLFWDACFDHGDIMTASDGLTYFFTSNCSYGTSAEKGVYRVLVTNDITSFPFAAQLSRPGNQQLISITVPNVLGGSLFACAAKGTNQDWCFAAIDDATDQLGNPGTWYLYKSEVLMIKMVSPFTVRRLFHHRARPSRGYCRSPRVNPNWDGTKLMFSSPFSAPDSANCGYSDIYRWDAP